MLATAAVERSHFRGPVPPPVPGGTGVNPGSGVCTRTDRRMSGGGQARAAHWRQGLRKRPPPDEQCARPGRPRHASGRVRQPKAQDRRDCADTGAGGKSGACSHGCRTTAVSSPAMSVIAKASRLPATRHPHDPGRETFVRWFPEKGNPDNETPPGFSLAI